MKVHAFEGPAGCGKTFQLLEQLKAHLSQNPLKENQKILSLTFMHGSRRRLSERLSRIMELRKRFDCATIDSFAYMLCRRWRSLSKAIGILPCDTEDYDKQCENAALLLKYEFVRKWVKSSFPIVVLDEAQDLSPHRLAIIQQLQLELTILVAADEFQCLAEELQPNPFLTWLPSVCVSNILTIPRRTNVAELLKAANDLRDGKPPSGASKNFKIQLAPSAPLAAAYAQNAIGWNKGNSFALITPSFKGGFAKEVIEKIGLKASRQGNGPYAFAIERSEEDLIKEIFYNKVKNSVYSISEAKTLIKELQLYPYTETLVISWIIKQHTLSGLTQISREELEVAVIRAARIYKQHAGLIRNRYLALSVHQAKNREFDGVLVIWPHTAAGSEEHKRRLLYNAITRAKIWCVVLVQSKALTEKSPFV
ncbi:MAG: ATP-dependent helicase [Chitinophagaceae bacterium]